MITKIFKTLRIQLLAIFLLFTLITTFVSVYCFVIYGEREKSAELSNLIHDASSKILLLNKLQLQFIIYDSKNNLFYQKKHSDYIKKHKELFSKVYADLEAINKKEDGAIFKSDLKNLKNELNDYKKDYETIIAKIQERGFWDNGLEGLMREYIHNVESYNDSIDMALLLTVRRNEKDYILRKDSSYINKHSKNIALLREKILLDNKMSVQGKSEIESLLNKYQKCFNQWVLIDREIGTDQGSGLTGKLKAHNETFENIISKVVKYTDNKDRAQSHNNKIFIFIAVVFSIILSIILSILLSSAFTRPIIQLSNSITQTVKNNFSTTIVNSSVKSKNEIGTLVRNFNWMVQQIHSYIEEIKMSEKTLNAKEKQFRALIENSSDAIALTDKRGKIIYASSSTLRVVGLNPESLLGKNTTQIVHYEDIPNLLNQFNEVISTPGKIVYIQFRIFNKNDIWKWVDGCFSNFLHEPSIQAVIINYRDITNRKKNEFKIEEQYKELQKINSELDRFVYSASHDLKAPLTSILGMISVAKMEPDNSSKLKYLEMTEVTTKKLLNIIKDLTNFSRNARLETLKEKICFSILVKESAELYSHLQNFEQIKFKVEIEDNFDFYSDQLRIKIMLNNLIANAIIYHNINQEAPFILISIKRNLSNVEILIKDNGQGIEPQFHAKIFDMFYRASENSVGSGLGLYIVKEIIEKLKGEIRLFSTPGIGTEFLISLPNMENTSQNDNKFVSSEHMVNR